MKTNQIDGWGRFPEDSTRPYRPRRSAFLNTDDSLLPNAMQEHRIVGVPHIKIVAIAMKGMPNGPT
jgi:hypothetical protein